MPTRQQDKQQKSCTTLSKRFDWNEQYASQELIDFGKSLEEAAKPSNVKNQSKDQLAAQFQDLLVSYQHALSLQTRPEAESNDDKCIENRAAIAASAAAAKGESAEGIAAASSRAVAAELKRLEQQRATAAADAAAKLAESEQRRVQAEAKAEREAEVARLAREKKEAEEKAAAQATRSRKRDAERAETALEEMRDAESVVESEAEPEAKKRKTAAERRAEKKSEYIEEHGEEAWEVKVAADKKAAKEKKAEKERVLVEKKTTEIKSNAERERMTHENMLASAEKVEKKLRDQVEKTKAAMDKATARKRRYRALVTGLKDLAVAKGATEADVQEVVRGVDAEFGGDGVSCEL